MSLTSRKANLLKTIERLGAQLQELEDLPEEPVGDPVNGDVVMVCFTKTFGRRIGQPIDGVVTYARYDYGALKASNGLWFVTASSQLLGVGGLDWDGLLEFIRKDEPTMPEVWVVTQVERLV